MVDNCCKVAVYSCLLFGWFAVCCVLFILLLLPCFSAVMCDTIAIESRTLLLDRFLKTTYNTYCAGLLE